MTSRAGVPLRACCLHVRCRKDCTVSLVCTCSCSAPHAACCCCIACPGNGCVAKARLAACCKRPIRNACRLGSCCTLQMLSSPGSRPPCATDLLTAAALVSSQTHSSHTHAMHACTQAWPSSSAWLPSCSGPLAPSPPAATLETRHGSRAQRASRLRRVSSSPCCSTLTQHTGLMQPEARE